jgi:hypothetical protein
VGDAREAVVMSRGEARLLVLGSLVGVPFWILLCRAFATAAESGASPGPAFWVGFVGMFVTGAALEPTRMRIRRRSGMRVWTPRLDEELRLMRGAAASCGWPVHAVEAVLVAAFVLCAAFFVGLVVPLFFQDR